MRTATRPVLALLALGLAGPGFADDLQIHVIEVGDAGSGAGQGLSVFVLGPDGTRVLIDGGNAGDGNAIVRPYLASLGVTDLDFSFATHWHTDHMGGMDEVFNGGYLPPVTFDRGDFMRPSNSQVSQYLSAVGGTRQTPTVGQTIAIGDGATITVEGVNGATGGGTFPLNGSETQFENASSIVLVIRYRDFECYVGGDVTAGGNGTPNVEGLAASAIGQVEVVVASHHGSNTSSSTSVVANLDPSLVIYSCGRNNPFGHPDDLVAARWSTLSSTRVQWSTTEGQIGGGGEAGGFTALESTILVETDGDRFIASRANGTGEVLFATFESTEYVRPGAGDVAVCEILVDPGQSSDSFGEWFELTNLTGEPLDMGRMRFQSGATTFNLESRILLRTNERLVIGADGKPYRNGDLFVNFSPPFGQWGLTNGTSTLTVRDFIGFPIEAIPWGAGGISVQQGFADERVDLFAPVTPGNFQNATATFGDGDRGTPGERNGAETTVWPPGLWMPDVRVGAEAAFFLTAPSDPVSPYFLGISLSKLHPGIPVLGVFMPIAPDGVFLSQLSNPDFASFLTGEGKRELFLQTPNDTGLVGLDVYSVYITVGFGPGGLFGKAASNLAMMTFKN